MSRTKNYCANTRPVPRDFTSDFDTTNQAVYGQLDTQLSAALRLSTGVRFENRQASYSDSDLVAHNVDEDIWGGRIALQYQLSVSDYGLWFDLARL